MKVNRLELLALLKALSPAVAGLKNSLPELSCIWFSGTHASAFDDILGIRIEFPTEFTGGVLGEKIIGVLERSRAKEVDIGLENDDLLFKIGNARIKLTRRPIEDWFWNPELPTHQGFTVTKAFQSAVEMSLISVGSTGVLNPEQRGITIIQNGKTADLYSTDAVSLSWTQIDTSEQKVFDHSDRLIIPTPFCERIKALKNKADLCFDENAVYCMTTIGLAKDEDAKDAREMLIFSKLVEDDNPVPFADVVKQNVTDETKSIEIPSQLKLRAERAMVLLGDQPADFEVEDESLYLYAQTPFGEVDDVLKIEPHPNVKAKIDVSLLRRALDSCDRMVVSKQSIVLTGSNGFLHILANK